MDCSPPGNSVHGISQARTLEEVAIPSPGDFPNPGIELASLALQAGSLPLWHLGSPTKAILWVTVWGLEVKDEVVSG